ncbi:MAG: hypothetical protein GY771_06780 [bacterium]|nr:hypothetical protein [bacterium]
MKIVITMLTAIYVLTVYSFAADEDLIAALRDWDEGYGEFGGELVLEGTIELKGGYTIAALSRTEEDFYASNVIITLLSVSGGRYQPIAYDDSFENYLPTEDVFNFIEVVDEERGLFAFGYLEGSAGSGMMTKYDNYVIGRVVNDEFEWLFVEYAHLYEDFYSRWYGGDNASAWSEGCVYEEISDFEYLYLEGDLPQILQTIFWRETEDDPFIFNAARLFRYSPGDIERYGKGKYVEVMGDKYIGQLQEMEGYRVKLLLGDWALWYRSDVKRAIASYEGAAASCEDPRVRDGVTELTADLGRYIDDPAEAIALYYADDFRGVIEEYPDSAIAEEAFFRAGEFGYILHIIENMKDHPEWPYVVQLMCYEEANEPGDIKPREFKRHVNAVLDMDDFPIEDKAQTCAYFGDWCNEEGEGKLAREYYIRGFKTDPTGPFSDYCATRAARLYEGDGDNEKALDWAIKSVGWDTYGWFSGDADHLISTIDIVNGGDVTSLSVLLDGDGLSFSGGDMDGDGVPELLVETRYNDGKTARGIIIGRGDDGYELLYRLPEDVYYSIYLDAGLDKIPCVYATSVDDKGEYKDFYELIIGYYNGDYKQLGRFYSGRESNDENENWRGYLEVEEGSAGRRIRVLEYDYIDGERVIKKVFGEYGFDEGAGEYVEK